MVIQRWDLPGDTIGGSRHQYLTGPVMEDMEVKLVAMMDTTIGGQAGHITIGLQGLTVTDLIADTITIITMSMMSQHLEDCTTILTTGMVNLDALV